MAVLLLAGMLGGARSAWALEPSKSLLQYPHRRWQTEDGLPQNSVHVLVQTPDGYLWGGTWEGLVRFDGVRFTVYDTTNTPALQGRSIRSLALDRKGTLWIGTNRGLAGLREGAFFSVTPPEGILQSHPHKLLASRDGGLWIATKDHGLVRFSEGRFQAWRQEDGLASDEVLALAEDGAGQPWVGSVGGLQRWDGAAWSAPLPFEGSGSPGVTALVVHPEGTLWAGTEAGEVYRLREGLMRRVPEASLPGAPISDLFVDRAGSLWVASLSHGLLRLAGGQRAVPGAGHLLAGSIVNDLFEDAEGNLWVGTEGQGLHRLKDAPFTPYGPPEGLAHEMAEAVFEARDGSFWFTTSGGVTRWHEGRMQSWTTRDGLLMDQVRTIAETPNGSIWLGSRSGISRWQAGTFTTFGTDQGLRDARAFLLAVDKGGTLWVGTPTGLARWNGQQFEPFTPRVALLGQHITLLRASDAGGVWVGTSSGGLAHLIDGQGTVLAPETGPISSRVLALHEDGKGSLWIGTTEGFFRWKEGRFRRLLVTEGLFDSRIFEILPDGRGNLWMSCNKGVFRVAQKELEALSEGRLERVTSHVYGTEDGMRSEECNALGTPAGWRDRAGRLWFPTIRGFVAYTPGQEERRAPPPPVLIEELRVDGKPVPPAEWGHLPVGEGQLEFQYTSAGLRAPQRLRFRYQLEGFDTDWVQAGARRVAYYTNLPPGRYRFRVAAEYSDSGEKAPGVEVAFYLKPRLHQTLLFRAACVLAVALAVAGAVWLRLQRLRRSERELQARVDQRTAELASVNADLTARLQELQATRERLIQAEKLAAVGTLAAGVGHELNNPLAFVTSNIHYVAAEVRALTVRDAERGRWEEVEQALTEALQGTHRMRRIIQDLRTFSRVQPMRLQRVDPHAVLELALAIADGELRHRARVVKDYGPLPEILGDETQLGQVFLNLLVNAAQAIPEGHANQHEIRITTGKDERGWLVVAVRDTGAGIPPEVLPRIFEPFFTTKPVGLGTGLGLSICHSYVQAMGGDIRVRSALGRGTTFVVVLPPAPEGSAQEQAAAPSPSGAPLSTVRGRLMVIDDEPLITQALARTLGPEHEVVSFTSARQALERLRAGERYELILCDLMMPEMTGMELHATLLQEAPGLVERMVFLTGGAFTEAARAFLDATHLPCLEKPFEPEPLRASVRALLLERRRTAAAAPEKSRQA